ncbi:hypothetical protein BN1708_001667 [Verticillium longisporum]|uniref:Pyridoxamine 5'-phosphate oxidase N-terminal domain-containing protein n=1 Tax=Verticillium longisporum TaxID=100787 RepID=A0A0G4MZJ0_VERLO|nr:hypothetical protein BN1708_001667 [Verticillium longisporum]
METAPLNYEASAGDTNKQYTATLPQDVIQCLENARFTRARALQLHLATCTDDVPNVSLMNYTYLPSSPFSAAPIIAMTTNPASRKTTNLLSNPNVSLLVHDWVTINGTARLLDAGSPEERFCREQHLENNTFDSEGFGPTSVEAEDGGRGCFVAGEEVRVIVVTIRDVRISDWKGSVRDFVLTTTNEDSAETAVNGVR